MIRQLYLARVNRYFAVSVLTWLWLLYSSLAIPRYAIDHAPLVLLHPDETFMPSDIGQHILHTAPRIDFEPIIDALPLLDVDNLSLLNKYGHQGKDVFLTAVKDVTVFPDWVYGETPDNDGALHNSTACAVVAVEHSVANQQAVVDVFYFYFYSWNEGADITQVVPPLNRIFPDVKPGNHFGNHLGDWEHNMIRFQAGEPVGIYFSHHTSGDICSWDDSTCLLKRSGRPVVFSARGSHANYPSAGTHIHDEALIDIAAQGRLWNPVSRAWFYSYHADTETFEPSTPDTPVDWLYFNGNWGDQQYPDSDQRQKTIPYFGLKKFQNGPNGPQFKHLLRQGITPDGNEKPVFLKTLVHWYLGLYGCCLKGVNAWVIIISFLVIFVALIVLCSFGTRFGVQKLRSALETRKEKAKGEADDVQLRLLDPAAADADDEQEARASFSRSRP